MGWAGVGSSSLRHPFAMEIKLPEGLIFTGHISLAGLVTAGHAGSLG